MAVIVPAGIIHYGIEAHAEHFDAVSLGLSHLGGDVPEPTHTGLGFSSGFGDENRTTITLPKVAEHDVQWTMLSVARGRAFALMHPLVIPVVIDTQNVERLGRATKLFVAIATQHVPRLILAGYMPLHLFDDLGGIRRVAGWRHDVDDWFCLNKACTWFDRAYGMDRRKRGTDELALQCSALALAVPGRSFTGERDLPGAFRLAGAEQLVPWWASRPPGWGGELLVAESEGRRARATHFLAAGMREAWRVDAGGGTVDALPATPEGDGFELEVAAHELAIVRWR